MSEDRYSVLVRAVTGLADQLEKEANLATEDKRQAEMIARQLFPDMSAEDLAVRLRQFDVRAEERARTVARLQRLLSSVVAVGSMDRP